MRGPIAYIQYATKPENLPVKYSLLGTRVKDVFLYSSNFARNTRTNIFNNENSVGQTLPNIRT